MGDAAAEPRAGRRAEGLEAAHGVDADAECGVDQQQRTRNDDGHGARYDAEHEQPAVADGYQFQ